MLIDGGERQCNVIYIGNLCKAIQSALFNEQAFGRVYNLTDGEYVSKKQLFDTICDQLGLPRVKRTIPRQVARLACELISTAAPFLPVSTQLKLSRFSRAAFRLAAVNQGFDITRAEQELSYKDRIPFQEGMKRTLVYFQAQMDTKN